ncbi:glycosyltransferase [Arthrobacter sp. MDT3-44]
MLASHLAPTYGLERTIVQVAHMLEEQVEISVAVMRGGPDDDELIGGLRLLGPQKRSLLSPRALATLLRSPWREHDVLILAGTWVALPWLLIGRRAGVRVLIWEHSLIEERMPYSRNYRVLRRLARTLYWRADTVVAVSDALADDLMSYPGVKEVHVIPNPLEESGRLQDHAASIAPDLDSQIRLLVVGSLSPMKRPHLAIEALALLDDRFILHVVGGGELAPQLQGLAEQLGVEHRVHFLGYRQPADVRNLMEEADLLVHTSISETFGLVYVEAARAKLPVLSTSNRVADALIPIAVPGRTVAANPSALRDGIVQTCSSKFEDSVWERSRQEREIRFGRATVVKQWMKVFHSILNSRSLSAGE